MQKVCSEVADGLTNQAKDHSEYTEKMSDSQGGRNGRWTRADRDNNLEDNIRDCKSQCNGHHVQEVILYMFRNLVNS